MAKPKKPKASDADLVKRFMEGLGDAPDPDKLTLPAPLPSRPPAVNAPPTVPGLAGALEIVGRADRQALEAWWRDQLKHIEYVTAKRGEMLAAVTEHPNAVFARLALTFGAEGKPIDVAATLLGMAKADFKLHYGHEWALGSAEVVGLASANLLRIALSSNDRYAVKAATEIVNRRGGEEWRPPAQKVELTRAPTDDENLIDSSKLTYEERQQLRAMIVRVTAGRGVAGQLAGPGEE